MKIELNFSDAGCVVFGGFVGVVIASFVWLCVISKTIHNADAVLIQHGLKIHHPVTGKLVWKEDIENVD